MGMEHRQVVTTNLKKQESSSPGRDNQTKPHQNKNPLKTKHKTKPSSVQIRADKTHEEL